MMLSARYRLLLLSKHHQRQKSYISEESRITLKLGKAKTSSIMHSTLNHHSLSPLFLRKIMTATQNKSQIKRETFQEVLPCRKRVTSLSRAPCQPHLQFKGPFAQNKTVIWGKKPVLLFGLIFPIHLTHSYIRSGGSSGRLRKGLCCHRQQPKRRHFLWLHPLGPLLLLR